MVFFIAARWVVVPTHFVDNVVQEVLRLVKRCFLDWNLVKRRQLFIVFLDFLFLFIHFGDHVASDLDVGPPQLQGLTVYLKHA